MNRAAAYGVQGDCERAMADYSSVIRLDPQNFMALFTRAQLYSGQGEHDKAIADYTEMVRLAPEEAAAHFNRGLAYMAREDFDKAISDFTEAIRLDPGDSAGYASRGYAYSMKKGYANAVADLSEAIRLGPENADAHNVLAWVWATCPDATFRDGKKAVEYAAKACQLTSWKDANQFETLAAAYAETGEFGKAVQWVKKGLESPDFPEQEREQARLRLKLYEQGKPYRDE
jgi:tetratricopeptide (TPR) repeat protein